MKSGTPGFIGERLREAREIRELSVIGLSGILDISRQAVYDFEKNKRTPSPDTFDKISRSLNFPKRFFLKGKKYKEDVPVFFRSMSSATKRERIRARHKLNWLKDIAEYVDNFVFLKEINIPQFEIKNALNISLNEVDEIASKCRRFWNLGDNPISNTTMLFENNGVIVTRAMIGSEKLDALSERNPESGRPYIFLSSDKENAVRSKFDICHEIGHIILHRSVKATMLSTPQEFKMIEAQAHRFASSFLLPEETFLSDLEYPSLDAFWALKEKWKVSIALMIRRCHDLDVIDDSEAKRLWINRTRRGWRKSEPLDNTLEVEKPKFLSRAVKLLLEEKVLMKENILNDLGLPRNSIEELVGLPEKYLETKTAVIEPFPTLRIKQGTSNKKDTPTKVISLNSNKKEGQNQNKTKNTPLTFPKNKITNIPKS